LASPLWIDVDDDAVIDTDHLEATLAAQPTDAVAGVTTLVANNEVGSLQPIDAVADIAHRFGVALHLDAVQGFGSIPLNLAREGVDAISISAHKMGGPVGVGALAVSRNAAAVDSLIHGGGQQVSRSGTLDAAGAAAFAAAATRAVERAAQESDTLVELRTRLSAGLSALEGVRVNGSDNRLHNNVHITMEGASGEVVLYLLDAAGVYVSTGSACQAGVAEASHVVQAMGRSHLEARSAIRLTLGESTTSDDIDTVLTLFPEVLEKAQRAGYPSA
jgi:cysteine desulfurase